MSTKVTSISLTTLAAGRPITELGCAGQGESTITLYRVGAPGSAGSLEVIVTNGECVTEYEEGFAALRSEITGE